MGKPYEEVKQSKNEYVKEYDCQLISGVGISWLRTVLKMRNKDESALRAGETLDDRVLCVNLQKEPDQTQRFPDEYKGVRVFYQVIGEIKG